mmetsp:Transcript_66909/g.188406  ORF Transcript_66909/g.188406 Transcript_66909/m.188406 type:complete len:216 (+) Transcript_66909:2201-2848(+)
MQEPVGPVDWLALPDIRDESSRQNIFLPSLPTAIAAFGTRVGDGHGLSALRVGETRSLRLSEAAFWIWIWVVSDGNSTRPSSVTEGIDMSSHLTTTLSFSALLPWSSAVIRSSRARAPIADRSTTSASVARVDTFSFGSCRAWHMTWTTCSWSYGTEPFSNTSNAMITTPTSSSRMCTLRWASELVREWSSFSAYWCELILTTALKILWKIFIAV